MPEIQATPESKQEKLERNYRLFFGTWGKAHSDEIEQSGFLDKHPSQSINCFKSESVAPTQQFEVADLGQKIEMLIRSSFKTNEQAEVALAAFDQPYPYENGNGRSYVEYLAEDFLDKGRNVCGTLVHADDGLTDIPRSAGGVKLALLKRYGARYLASVGEVASPSLKYETYLGIDVPEILPMIGDVVWLPPAESDSVEKIRKIAGLSDQDLKELFEYVIAGGQREIIHALKHLNPPGHVYFISPPGSRAITTRDQHGDLESLKPKPVTQGAANLIGRFDALWPISILNYSMTLGPIINLPERAAKKDRDIQNMQNVEDAVEVNVMQINQLVGKEGLASYDRSTERGTVYAEALSKEASARALGAQAIAAS